MLHNIIINNIQSNKTNIIKQDSNGNLWYICGDIRNYTKLKNIFFFTEYFKLSRLNNYLFSTLKVKRYEFLLLTINFLFVAYIKPGRDLKPKYWEPPMSKNDKV